MNISRRSMMLGAVGAAITMPALMLSSTAFATTEESADAVSAQTALQRLRLGNRRYRSGDTIKKSYAPPGKKDVQGQWPFATVLSCSDSRVDPEDIFDLRPGNLFVVRVAGNVVDDDVLGSLEYSVEHLNVPLIVVLGHSMCGAVAAADDSLKSGIIPAQYIGDLVEKILPAIRPLPADHSLATAVAANAQQSARQIQARSAVIAKQTAAGAVIITQATYGLGSRQVAFF